MVKLTARHKAAQQALEGDRPSVTILRGYAGTGKTYTAMEGALKWLGGDLRSKKSTGKKKLVVVRPNEAFAKDIGFLPGSKEEKMEPWMLPIKDSLTELGVSQDVIADAFVNGVIEVVPLAYVQGRTFHNSYVITDECQNASFDQLMMVWTRLGRFSKLVYCGDEKQTAQGVKSSGLDEMVSKCEGRNVNVITFTKEDNLRSELSQLGLEIWGQ